MIRKIIYSLTAPAAWLALASTAFAQTRTYTVTSGDIQVPPPPAGVVASLMIFWIAVCILLVVSMWIIFRKAGKPGWAAIIPIYNTFVLLEVVGRPLWWFLLMLIPFVNIIITIIVLNDLSVKFGKGGGFTVGLVILPFIFLPILAFSKASYMTQTMPSQPMQPVPPPTQM